MNRIDLTSNSLADFCSLRPNLPSADLPSADRGLASQTDEAEEQEVRWDLIRRLRREIAAGTYANQGRWQRAVEGLSNDLAG